VDNRQYLCIDLKSFYASVECVERGLDPMTTNLVVADRSRTAKTICLAVTPSLKAYGIPGRARLFEVIERVKAVNRERKQSVSGMKLRGASFCSEVLCTHPEKHLGYLVAKPRMALYMQKSTQIFSIYMKYVSPEDVHVYSVDEVFVDITHYLKSSGLSPREFAKRMIQDVKQTTGITAAAGIGPNLYLAKVAMDIKAKHILPDSDGVLIAELDEMGYREELWDHTPLTDFWRVGRGYMKKLEKYGLHTMGDIARCSVGKATDFHNEKLLYQLFGINAELLIDHAWGWEPCTIQEIKAYKPESNSLGHGQVLSEPYDFEHAKLIVREMTDLLALELVRKGLVTDQLTLTVGYDKVNLTDSRRRTRYKGPVTTDHYGRQIPKHGHGTANLGEMTASTKVIVDAMMELFDRVADPDLLVRRMNVVANRIVHVDTLPQTQKNMEQMDLFSDPSELQAEQELKEREKRMQQAVLEIKERYGKNAILKGMNFKKGATARERNAQIGGHKA